MKWTKEKPTNEGYYWYRTAPDNGVLTRVKRYESGIARYLVAELMIPSCRETKLKLMVPEGLVESMNGEWTPANITASSEPVSVPQNTNVVGIDSEGGSHD